MDVILAEQGNASTTSQTVPASERRIRLSKHKKEQLRSRLLESFFCVAVVISLMLMAYHTQLITYIRVALAIDNSFDSDGIKAMVSRTLITLEATWMAVMTIQLFMLFAIAMRRYFLLQ